VQRRSHRGKVFYSCNRYPDCKNAYWDKPTGELCTTCNAMMVQPVRGDAKCSNKECKTNEGKSRPGAGRFKKKIEKEKMESAE